VLSGKLSSRCLLSFFGYQNIAAASLKVMRGHCSSVRDVAFSSSGRHLASAALDGEVRIWFTSTGTHVSSPDFMAGGMAQWFGRQSLSGGLSLIYA